jgi:hypothetical protein
MRRFAMLVLAVSTLAVIDEWTLSSVFAGVCGDGSVDPGETCDPPGAPAGLFGQPCRADCTVCGDLITQPPETCDGVVDSPGCRTLFCASSCELIFVDPCFPRCSEFFDGFALAITRRNVASNCDCASAASHGAYVSCARSVVKSSVGPGGLPRVCQGMVVRGAAKSTCGKPGAVACCRTSATGSTSCSIRPDAASCRASLGGAACVSSHSSCADACTQNGCASP